MKLILQVRVVVAMAAAGYFADLPTAEAFNTPKLPSLVLPHQRQAAAPLYLKTEVAQDTEKDLERQEKDLRRLVKNGNNEPTKPILPKEPHDFSHDIPLDIVAQRAIDTAEDALVHFNRQTFKSTLTPEQDAARKTVVVLGSGWAAHAMFKIADHQKLRVIVISPTNHFVFTPMLTSAATGTVEYRSMTEPVRAANPMIEDYIQGSAVGLDVAKKTVTVELSKLAGEEVSPALEIPYDHLVVSVGSKVHDFNVKGVKEHALKLKSIDDARTIREAIGECLEHASSPGISDEERTRRATFLIAGGGPTGVEMAGELSDLIADVTRKSKGSYSELANSTRVIVVEGGPTLVPPFNKRLREEALKTLEAEGVEVMLNTFVTEVSDNTVSLSVQQVGNSGKPLKERKTIQMPAGLTIWAAGTCPQPFVGTLLDQLPAEARNQDGRVKVDRWMRAPMKDPSLLGSVLVLGDAAAHPCSEYAPVEFLPPTAQVAGQQGAYLGRTLSRGYNLSATPPHMMDEDNAGWKHIRGLDDAPEFHFINLGVLAYLGGGAALSQIQLGEVPVLSQAGAVGYLLWRSVYLAKQVATRNRALVLFDWIKTNIFGRDMTRF